MTLRFLCPAKENEAKESRQGGTTLAYGFLRFCYCLRQFQELAIASRRRDRHTAWILIPQSIPL